MPLQRDAQYQLSSDPVAHYTFASISHAQNPLKFNSLVTNAISDAKAMAIQPKQHKAKVQITPWMAKCDPLTNHYQGLMYKLSKWGGGVTDFFQDLNFFNGVHSVL